MRAQSAFPRAFGPYQLLAVLGSGGSATVYKAERDGQLVALKVLHNPLCDEVREERFAREADVLADLNHPGLVKLHEFDEWDGRSYMALELLDATPIDEYVEALTEPTSPESRQGEQLRWLLKRFEEVATTLAYLHEHGLIHRDVKPENILIDHDGRARLVDLGLAHDEAQEAITMAGDLLGTVYYLSPEQAMSNRVDLDHTTDIYSLGASLYYCLTQHHPYEGQRNSEILRKMLLHEPTPLSKLRPELPVPLRRLVEKCMDKDSRQRYQLATEVARDLRDIRNLRDVRIERRPWPPRARRWARRNRGVLLSAVVVLLVALLILRTLQAPYGQWHAVEMRWLGPGEPPPYTLSLGQAWLDIPAGQQGALPTIWGAPRVPTGALALLTLTHRGESRRYTYVPCDDSGDWPVPVGWLDPAAVTDSLVAISGNVSFLVRDTPLTWGDVTTALAPWVDDLTDETDPFQLRALHQRAEGHASGEVVERISLQKAQAVASALGYRLMTAAEWNQIYAEVKDGSRPHSSLCEMITNPPGEMLTSPMKGVGADGMPLPPDATAPAVKAYSPPKVVRYTPTGPPAPVEKYMVTVDDVGVAGVVPLVLDRSGRE